MEEDDGEGLEEADSAEGGGGGVHERRRLGWNCESWGGRGGGAVGGGGVFIEDFGSFDLREKQPLIDLLLTGGRKKKGGGGRRRVVARGSGDERPALTHGGVRR